MSTYARCDTNGVVLEIFVHETLTPAATHIPSIAAQFVPAPDNAEPGGTLVNDRYTAPVPKAAPVRCPVMAPAMFALLWTVAEEVQLEELQASDPNLAVMFRRWQDPRVTEIDMNLQSVQDSIAYALGKLNLTADVLATRKAEILSGVLK